MPDAGDSGGKGTTMRSESGVSPRCQPDRHAGIGVVERELPLAAEVAQERRINWGRG